MLGINRTLSAYSVAVVLNLRVQGAGWLAGALIALALADVITFSFHYPRNDVMFVRPLTGVSLAELEAAARQWALGNYVRVALLAVAVASALRGLSNS